MRKTISSVLVGLCLLTPIQAQNFCATRPADASFLKMNSALGMLKSQDCSILAEVNISNSEAEVLIQEFLAERASMEDLAELMAWAHSIRCSLSSQSREALDALAVEAEVRRFDVNAFARGEIEPVVKALMPEAWETLLAETAHLDDRSEKAEPLTIGCIMIFIAGAGAVTACLLDVGTAKADCEAGRVCPPGKFPWAACCSIRATEDQHNCVLSAGTNGPDNDFHLCCFDQP